MMRKSVILTAGVALLGLGACGDALSVPNVDEPDIARVLSTAEGVESTIAGLGSQLNNPQRASESVATQSRLMAHESYGSVANFGMAARIANPGLIINDLGNDHSSSNFNNYRDFQQLARAAANALAAFETVREAGNNTLSANAENRMRAFAYLILGQTMANVSFAYDSGAAVAGDVGSSDIPELIGAVELNAAAIEALDSAVVIAGRGMSSLTWISGRTLNQAAFIRLARSYRARTRAAVARTPAERAAVDWVAVIADATAGITADHEVAIGGTTGWSAQLGQMYTPGGWHSYPMMFAGMADSSGAYQDWVATPAGSRRAFLVQTADQRWASGNTRADQQADTPNNSIAPKYIRNRPSGDDVQAPGSGESWYDHRRWGATMVSTTGGPYTDMSKAEMDLLAAEGYLRTSQEPLAVPLINTTRAANGLADVTALGVPNAQGCVPRLPNGTCGTLWDALKYEKRMETAFTGYMNWFTDMRGWGDLPAGTAIEWPVPYQEMQARQKPFYNSTRQSGASTYGF